MSSRIIQNCNSDENVELDNDVFLTQVFAIKLNRDDAQAWDDPSLEVPDDMIRGRCQLWTPETGARTCTAEPDETLQIGIDVRVKHESCTKIFSERTCAEMKNDTNENEGKDSLYVRQRGDTILNRCSETENCRIVDGNYEIKYPFGDKGHSFIFSISPPSVATDIEGQTQEEPFVRGSCT